MAESKQQQLSRPEAGQSVPSYSFSGVPSLSRKIATEDFARPSKRQRVDAPPPMTAAAAFADARHRSKSPAVTTSTASASEANKTSPNPATEAISALMGVSQNAVSNAYTTTKVAAQNPTSTLSEGLKLAAEHMHPPADAKATNNDSHAQTSPTSISSFDTQDSVTATSGIATTVASPMPVENAPHQPSTPAGSDVAPQHESSRSYPFPTPLLQPQSSEGRRGMSLPQSGLRQNTRSPSSRRHKCPYCGTEFTRHHNLKSHLLTHSQEKPYVCSTCQSRFRRLHDLKRHTKLHTGERPHVCPKCNRKFARGDALARHNKGPGGCAGRRASVGSFGGDDDYEGGDDTMDGIQMYGEPETMDDMEGDAARGTPSIRRQAASGDDNMDEPDHQSRIPSTYPPIQGRPPGGIAGGSFPPRQQGYGPAANIITSGPSPATLYPSSGSSSRLGPSNPGSIFAQNSITESPKPISPGQAQPRGSGSNDNRMQSPNMPHFQPPQPYNRNMSSSGPSIASQSSGPQLPPPHGLNPPDPRYTLASQGAPTHPPTQPSGPPTHMSGSGPLSSSNSLSSHGQSGHGSGENASSMFNKDERIWAYVKDLEKKMTTMQDEINTLKTQLAVAIAPKQVR